MNVAEPRLVLKTTPPRPSRQLLERARLSIGSQQLRDMALLRIEAPAGFGKTSLLSQWRREWQAAGARVAWVTLDEHDDEPSRLIHVLCFALEQATSWKPFARIRERAANDAADLDRLTEWLAEVAQFGSECVLILDEMERLPEAMARQALPYLFCNLPANLKVVIASRTRPKVRYADFAGRTLAARLFTAGALRFSLAETIATLRARFGARFDADTAQRIHDLTEGWPLGLQLVVAAMEQGMAPDETVALMGARGGDLRLGFVQALLSQLPPDKSDFLVRISILERIHAELCTALTGRADSAAVLDELRGATPVLAGDVEGQWLRLHGLVRDFLRQRFEALPTAQRKAVHAAAAAWLEESGLYDEAARHALAAGQAQWAWQMAEKSLLYMMERAQVVFVEEWLARSPVPVSEQRPELLLTSARCSLVNGRPQEAAALAGRVADDPRSTAAERVHAQQIVSSAAIRCDDIDLAARTIECWRSAMLADPGLDRVNALSQLAWMAVHRGDVSEARRLLGLQQAAGQSFVVEIFTVSVWGTLYLWEGRVRQAIDALGRVSERVDAEVGRRSSSAATLAGMLAFALYESGDDAAAEAALAGRLDVIEQLATPSGLLYGYVAASRLAALRGDHARAHEILEALYAAGERRAMQRVQFVALAELVRQHARLGQARRCAALLARFEAAVAATPRVAGALWAPMLQLHAQLATAWAARARGDWLVVGAALEIAMPLAERLHRGREQVEIGLLRAEVLHADGAEDGGVRREALGLAQALGLRREFDPAALPAGAAAVPAPLANVKATALLTAKEQRVLSLLAQRLSNKQIAARLDLGPTTIKWHLKNTYSKLNAANREHAIQRARMLGILEAG